MKAHKILQSYGLSEKEARVYLACLQTGPSPVYRIAEKAALPRSTTYEVLDDLVARNFVNSFQKKKIKYYSAEEPSHIVHLAQSRVEELKDTLPELNALAGKSRVHPTVRFYQGKEGMKIIFEEMLAEANVLYSFAAAEDLLQIMGNFQNHFVEQRLQKKIPVKIILRDSPTARERQRLGRENLRTVKIVPSNHEFHGAKYIWKNKMAMFSFTNDYVAVVIDSHELYDMELAMFNYLWERS